MNFDYLKDNFKDTTPICENCGSQMTWNKKERCWECLMCGWTRK